MDISELRRRVRAATDQARRDAAGRRERSDAVSLAFERFLGSLAVPTFTALAAALVAEGHRFKVLTPAGSVRLASERWPDDFVELTLESSEDPPFVLGRTSQRRGRQAVTRERPVRVDAAPDALTEEDVITFVLSEITPLIGR
jgi:hypothetical protein